MRFSVTVRFGTSRKQYRVYDVDAESGSEALRRAAEAMPVEADGAVDLVELRRTVEPEARSYTPE